MHKSQKLFEKIDHSNRFLILTHENPDGDALGSMLALSISLKQSGKYVDCVCASPTPQPFLFLPKVSKIKNNFFLGDYDLIFILDCGDLKRTGFADRIKYFARKKAKKVVNIDHHPKNDVHKISWFNLIDYRASSTSELIYLLLKDMQGTVIDKDIATCLFCGIYTDTGGFRHSNTTVRVLKTASELLHCGARLKLVTNNIVNGKSVSALKLWGLVLSRAKKDSRLGLITSVITKEDLKSCQASIADLAGAVNLINAVPETRAAILFSEPEDGKIKASIRTENNNIDVGKLANIFGGGGLKKAAGFTIAGKIIKDKTGNWQIKYI